MRAVPREAFELARQFEGLRLTAYRCPAGVLTIGYGATGRDIKPGMVVTIGWAIERLRLDLEQRLPVLLRLCPILVTESDQRVAAILDFLFNLGVTRLTASTLRRYINRGDWRGAERELGKWIWGGGRKLSGLILRRAAEARLIQLPL